MHQDTLMKNIVFFDFSLIEKIKSHDTIILLGETGCGKSTQIPQYILEEKINRGCHLVVTQVSNFSYQVFILSLYPDM